MKDDKEKLLPCGRSTKSEREFITLTLRKEEKLQSILQTVDRIENFAFQLPDPHTIDSKLKSLFYLKLIYTITCMILYCIPYLIVVQIESLTMNYFRLIFLFCTVHIAS